MYNKFDNVIILLVMYNQFYGLKINSQYYIGCNLKYKK